MQLTLACACTSNVLNVLAGEEMLLGVTVDCEMTERTKRTKVCVLTAVVALCLYFASTHEQHCLLVDSKSFLSLFLFFIYSLLWDLMWKDVAFL